MCSDRENRWEKHAGAWERERRPHFPPLFESLARILLSGFELDTDYPCPGTVLVLSCAKCACRTVSSELFHRSLDCSARRSVNGIGLC